MSLLNKVMSLLGLSDEEAQSLQREREHEPESMYEPEAGTAVTRKGATVVSLHAAKQVRVVLCEAKQFDDAQSIADHMRARRPVVLNLTSAPYDVALRILDFMSGTTYALGGRIEKLGQNVFLCAPENVEIQGSITDLLQAAAQAEGTSQTRR